MLAACAERPHVLLQLVASLGGFLPAREGRDALRTGLVRAGYRRADAVLVFLGAKLICAVLLPVTGLWIGFSSGRPLGNIFVLTLRNTKRRCRM